MINYYKILEIPDFSDDRAIKKAYRTLSKKYHPDVNPNQQAQQYFIVIKEAYEYLSDPKNKRYLDDILVRQRQIKNQAETFTSPNPTYWQQPHIHYFKSNTSYYSLDDIVVIEWSVEGAKSVEIDYLGKVNSAGKHGLKLKRFEEELEVNMRVTGFDNQYYYRKLAFKYRDKNPNVEAWRQQRKINPNVRQEHFKNESLFWMYGRVAAETFRFRLIVATVLLALALWISFWQQWAFIFYLSVFVYGFFVLVTIPKRIHDLNYTWSEVFSLNPKILFTRQGIRKTNNYGPYRPPKYLNFKDACRKVFANFKTWAFTTKLVFSATLLSVIWVMLPYFQPVEQRDFSQARFAREGRNGVLILDEEVYLPIDYELYYGLRKGVYESIEINQFMFTGEVVFVDFWADTQLQKTVYYGFIGNRPILFFTLIFLLMFEWQLIRSYSTIKNKGQLSQMMGVLGLALLMAWKLM